MLISANPTEKRTLQAIYEERFGIPARAMEEWFVYSTGSVLWGLRDAPHLDEALAALRFERTGIPLLRKAGRHWKPTTVALQVVGEFVSRNMIELCERELETILIEGELRGTREGVEQGYVALAGPDGVVGCGLYLAPCHVTTVTFERRRIPTGGVASSRHSHRYASSPRLACRARCHSRCRHLSRDMTLDPSEEQSEGLLISQLPKAKWSGLKSSAAQTLPGR